MCSTNKNLLTGLSACMLIVIVGNIIASPCMAQPLDTNTTISEKSKLANLKESSKPLLPVKVKSISDLEAPISNAVQQHRLQNRLDLAPSRKESDFPDRRGFFTGHRIPLELFGDETLRHIELIDDAKKKESEALERVPEGYPRRIPLELFSKESIRRIDGLEDEEGKGIHFPRRIPLELFDDETLKRIELLEEKDQDENAKETSKDSEPTAIPSKAKSYVNSDFLRASDDVIEELKRTPRFAIHGGISDDPEAAAHHFPALTIGGEGDPAFLDTLLSYYN